MTGGSLDPNGRGLDGIIGSGPGIAPAAAGEAADYVHFHVLLANDLAAQTQAFLPDQPARGEHIPLGLGHARRFTGDELNSTGRAAGVSAAGVQLIGVPFIDERIDHALARRNLHGNFVDRQHRHGNLLRMDYMRFTCGWKMGRQAAEALGGKTFNAQLPTFNIQFEVSR
jgi:hypothetical protein